jgi:hypothetical protein
VKVVNGRECSSEKGECFVPCVQGYFVFTPIISIQLIIQER